MMADVSPQSIVVATDEPLYADVEGETVVLHADAQTYYSLNPVASRIWELLQDPHSIEEIRDTIVNEYDVSSDRCEADLLKFLELLAEEDLVEFRSV